ncbi:sulfite exporter TauE/SafE family protein [uncultured Ilyobacter sp.]|jgi:uncharacterized membrane protein YfcA|uniref:sulfite exporter TauE/SafE family protein n=1 Tax=uncultured Ilyobacter sp. TaxID=544433 RepID=UPI0029C052C6|nr:sulfite exporter TauE/SafE family protein [uncultured Ilyobacter sp.]
MVSPIKDILFLLVIFSTNAIQAITGFAGTLLAMPPSILLIGVNEARAVLNIVTWISCFVITFQNYQWTNKKELKKIIIFMLVSMVLGLKLYEILPLQLLLTTYGILIILIALKGLLIEKSFNIPSFLMLIVLVSAGIIHGMFVSGGSLLVIYAVKTFKDKNEFRATIAPVWVILNTFMVFDHIGNGYITKKVVILLLLSIIPMFLGIGLGNKLYDKINQKLFLKFTYLLLGISGLLVVF